MGSDCDAGSRVSSAVNRFDDSEFTKFYCYVDALHVSSDSRFRCRAGTRLAGAELTLVVP